MAERFLMKDYMKILSILAAFVVFFSCTNHKQKVLLINGAGASFPYILYSKWLYEYRKVKPSVAINYQSIGSGGGIRQFLSGTLDFGGTDVPISFKELKKANKTIVHIPTALGSVAVTYNLDIGKKDLNLDGETLSQIFRGQITSWDNPQIKKLNPTVNFTNEPIVVVYRADGSGTTSFFTEFLSKASKDFLKKVGKGKSVNWPVGIGGKGNEGVMGLVNKMQGAISYVSLSYVLSQNLPVAKIKNKSGEFITPSSKSVKLAADHILKKGKSFTTSLIYAGGKGSYPLSGFTYIIISKKMPREKGKIIVDFLKWALNSGQKFSEALYFISLPNRVKDSALKKLSSIEYK